jgi:hypothetical protein
VQAIGVIDRMSGFMPQELHAPIVCASFDLEHFGMFDSREAWVCKEKGDGESGGSIRREPVSR